MVYSKVLRQGVFAALVGAAALVTTAGSASAYVACNRWGECWHVHDRYRYRPAYGIVIRSDNWYWHHRHDHRWRWRPYHHGRGYWRHGVWITF